MVKGFRDRATEDLFHGINSKAARRQFPRELWSVMRRRLDALHKAASLQDLSAVPGNRLESLPRTMPGFYSIRVNDRFRLTFQWKDGHAYEVSCEDYH